jgi:hypothetical protein
MDRNIKGTMILKIEQGRILLIGSTYQHVFI